MPIIRVTQADLMKTKTIEPGIYGLQVVKVHPIETSAKGNSYNQRIDFLVEGANGKEIPAVFNTLLIGKIAPLVEAALGIKFEPGEFDTDLLLNKKVDGQVGVRTFEGNLLNEITSFYPYGKGKTVGAVPF